MKFKLSVNCNNAAFNDYPEYEVSRILIEVKDMILRQILSNSIQDINGNTVGKFSLTL